MTQYRLSDGKIGSIQATTTIIEQTTSHINAELIRDVYSLRFDSIGEESFVLCSIARNLNGKYMEFLAHDGISLLQVSEDRRSTLAEEFINVLSKFGINAEFDVSNSWISVPHEHFSGSLIDGILSGVDNIVNCEDKEGIDLTGCTHYGEGQTSGI